MARHAWGPWIERLSIWGEFYGYAERRCQLCGYTQVELIPNYCEKWPRG